MTIVGLRCIISKLVSKRNIKEQWVGFTFMDDRWLDGLNWVGRIWRRKRSHKITVYGVALCMCTMSMDFVMTEKAGPVPRQRYRFM